MAKERFLKINGNVISTKSVAVASFNKIEELEITVVTIPCGVYTATGIEAIEAAMILRPSVLEGKRLKWAKRAWMIHNLVGHPLMQVLAMFKQYDLAMWVHDVTVPKPEVAYRIKFPILSVEHLLKKGVAHGRAE